MSVCVCEFVDSFKLLWLNDAFTDIESSMLDCMC
jgi:hypothetical protein